MEIEAQAGVVAVDALEFSKLFYVGMFVPFVSMQDDSVLREIGMSPVVTDAKALFDAARNMSVTQGLSAANKRTAIDVKIVCERMSRFDGQWYWTDTLQQVIYGLTTVQARQRLVQILRRGYHALKLCGAGYSGRTVKIVKELRQKFDLARSDHNSPFAHPVRCMDPLRSTFYKIYSQHAPTKLSDRYGTPCLPLLRSTRWEQVDKRMLSRRHAKARERAEENLHDAESGGSGTNWCKGTKRERAEENLHDAESGGFWYKLVVSGGEALPSLLVDYGSATLGNRVWIRTWKETSSTTTIRGDLVCLFASDLLVLNCQFCECLFSQI